MSTRLAITGLSVRYGTTVALTEVDLQIARGERVALVGESGAGKSTLARAAVGLVPVQAGRILHGDVELATARGPELRAMRRKAQLVFQDAGLALDPRQRVGPALREARRTHGLPPRDDLLPLVGLESGHAGRFPHELSGGQRQRVLLARALALEPDLLLLDEPTAALDTLTRARILDLVGSLTQDLGLALLVITHDLPAAARLAQRVVVLERGKIVEEGSVRTVLGAPAHPHTRALVAAAR